MSFEPIDLRPALRFAAARVCPLMGLSIVSMVVSWTGVRILMLAGALLMGYACYRLLYIRTTRYLFTSRYVRLTRGVFLRKATQVDLHQLKAYTLSRPRGAPLFCWMNLELETTDPAHPVILVSGIPVSHLVDDLQLRVEAARKELATEKKIAIK